jgi:hypothetical protein
MISVIPISSFQHPHWGLLYTFPNPGLEEPNDLKGQIILISGTPCLVEAVETYQIARPYPRNMNIAVAARPV